MKETYKVNVYCRNCDWKGTQDIPKKSTHHQRGGGRDSNYK